MASTVIAPVDRYLAVRSMTYIYQIMQTQVLVAAVSASPISPHQDNRTRSSLVVIVSLSQITRCSDSASDKYQAGEINSYTDKGIFKMPH